MQPVAQNCASCTDSWVSEREQIINMCSFNKQIHGVESSLRSSASRETMRILWLHCVHNRVNKSPPLVPVLNQMNSAHTFILHFHFNIILPSMLWSSLRVLQRCVLYSVPIPFSLTCCSQYYVNKRTSYAAHQYRPHFLHPGARSSLLGPDILTDTLYLISLSRQCFLNVNN